jgi:hypothetical protein
MATYRKKPVEIQAVQWTGNVAEMLDHLGMCEEDFDPPLVPDAHFTIETLEGEMRADLGDWVICGVKGEFYPCKPDIFAATYDEVFIDTESRRRSTGDSPEC